MRSKELWLVERNRTTVKPVSSVPPCWRKCWKYRVRFCHRSSPVSRKAWTLPWKLQELKKCPRKTSGYGQPRGHLIRVLREWKGRKWRWKFLSPVVGDSQISLIVLETHFNCDTVDRGLWLAILSSLLCPEMDRNIRIGKQGYVRLILILFYWF